MILEPPDYESDALKPIELQAREFIKLYNNYLDSFIYSVAGEKQNINNK